MISPVNLLMIGLLLALLASRFNYSKLARILFRTVIALTFILGLIPIGSWMLHPLETRFQHNPDLPDKLDGIIILGGSISPKPSNAWQQLETNEYAERLTTMIELANRFPDARLIFTGGNGNTDLDRPGEAEILQQYIHRLGIAPGRVEFETRARNTAENALLVKAMVNPEPGSTWLLVTTAFHMPRSVGVFCNNNWSVLPYPVDHHSLPEMTNFIFLNPLANFNQLDLAVHEWLGLIAYYVTGKIDRLVPEGCQ